MLNVATADVSELTVTESERSPPNLKKPVKPVEKAKKLVPTIFTDVRVSELVKLVTVKRVGDV